MKKLHYSLIISAFLLFGTAWYLRQIAFDTLRGHNWKPLQQNIRISPGLVLNELVHTDFDGYYEINLDVDSQLPSTRTYCLLGIPPLVKKCQDDIKSVIAMNWMLKKGEQVVASGNSEDSHGGYWGKSAGRTIGRFRAIPGNTYGLEIWSACDGGELNTTNPKIIVAVTPRSNKGAVDTAQLAGLASFACIVLSALLLLGVAIAILY